jgi:hypothetical protein
MCGRSRMTAGGAVFKLNRIHTEEVTGSSPVPPTTFHHYFSLPRLLLGSLTVARPPDPSPTRSRRPAERRKKKSSRLSEGRLTTSDQTSGCFSPDRAVPSSRWHEASGAVRPDWLLNPPGCARRPRDRFTAPRDSPVARLRVLSRRTGPYAESPRHLTLATEGFSQCLCDIGDGFSNVPAVGAPVASRCATLWWFDPEVSVRRQAARDLSSAPSLP